MSRPQDDLAEYVLGTLTPAAHAEADAYLASSAAARAEVRELRETLVTLTEALPPAVPKAEVWNRIQAGLATENLRLGPDLAFDAPPPVTVFRPPGAPASTKRLSWPVAACLSLIAVGSLFWGVRNQSAYRNLAGEAQLVSAFLAEPRVQKVTLLGPDNQGVGGVLLEPEGQALFVLDRAPGRGRAYQAWGHTSDDWEPGSSEQLVSLKVSRDKVFAVTTREFAALYLSLEPARGSSQPTQPLSRLSLGEAAPTAPLEIIRPANGAVVSVASVIVSGSVETGMTGLSYTVNGGRPTQTSVAGQRFFFTVAGLQRGLNTVEVSASFGERVVTETVAITYTPTP